MAQRRKVKVCFASSRTGWYESLARRSPGSPKSSSRLMKLSPWAAMARAVSWLITWVNPGVKQQRIRFGDGVVVVENRRPDAQRSRAVVRQGLRVDDISDHLAAPWMAAYDTARLLAQVEVFLATGLLPNLAAAKIPAPRRSRRPR